MSSTLLTHHPILSVSSHNKYWTALCMQLIEQYGLNYVTVAMSTSIESGVKYIFNLAKLTLSSLPVRVIRINKAFRDSQQLNRQVFDIHPFSWFSVDYFSSVLWWIQAPSLLTQCGPLAQLVCSLYARSGKRWHHKVPLNAAQASQLASFCRPGKAQPPPGKNTAQERPHSVAGISSHASLSGILSTGAMLSRFRV